MRWRVVFRILLIGGIALLHSILTYVLVAINVFGRGNGFDIDTPPPPDTWVDSVLDGVIWVLFFP